MRKTDITVKDNAAIQAYDYGEQAGGGFDNTDGAHISLPFLTILQGLSPQVIEGRPEGSKPGMLFNTVTEELSRECLILPAYAEHVYVEWVPRSEGGGFRGVHAPNSDAVRRATAPGAFKDFGKFKNQESGNDLSQTFYLYAVQLGHDLEPLSPICLAFTSTKISVYRNWFTKISMFTRQQKSQPPLWAHATKVSTVAEKNAKGSFFNFAMGPYKNNVRESLLSPGHPAYLAGSELNMMARGGLCRLSYDQQQDVEAAPF